jgi:hypothetical protein
MLMAKKPSWDDIPSLNLELDDGDTPAGQEKELRSAVRLISRDLLHMLMEEARVIYVQVADSRGILKKKGILQDINQCGLCFIMPGHGLRKHDSVKVGVMLGKRPFKTAAIVRWATNDKVGVEYVRPNPDDVEFLKELYSAKILNRV